MATTKKASMYGKKSGLEFNHAMIYTRKFKAALKFYQDVLGFRLLDRYGDGYARLQSPAGRTTIALHVLDEGSRLDPATEGMRLYFEVRELDAFCAALRKKRVKFDQLPEDMPWGWRHAYLRDPDGHEVSLYWAGAGRFRPTTIRR